VIKLHPRNVPTIDMILRMAAIALLVFACLQVIQPFLGALTWAGIIAVSTWPAYQRLCGLLKGRQALAATLLVIALGTAIILPLALLATSLVDSVPNIASFASGLADIKQQPPPQWLSSIPLLGPNLIDIWQSSHSDISGLFTKAKPYIDQTAYWALGQGAQLGKNLVVLVLALILSGVFLVYGDASWRTFEKVLARLGGKVASDLPDLVARTIRSVTNGVVGTALVQGLLTIIGLLISGVPGAVILGFLCFLIAVAQLPTLIVWAPAAAWLFYSGSTGYAIFLTLWGLLLVNTIDNIVKPYLISHGAGLPLPLIFLGVIGGLLSWGLIGLFIGPTALAVGYTVFSQWLNKPLTASAAENAITDEAGNTLSSTKTPH
jgi:predicted PurR-regulated permease PerM